MTAMTDRMPLAAEGAPRWLDDAAHRAWLGADAARQVAFYRPTLRADGGFDIPATDGTPLPRGRQELHTTTRMVHSFAIARAAGFAGCDAVIDAGMDWLWRHHRDADHGGYVWAVGPEGGIADGIKMNYGHVFVLLAGASAKEAGHPDADRLIADISDVLDRRFWEEGAGLFADEFTRDWQVFSTYRGYNSNMHGVEALLAAHEATGEALYRDRAGRILEFFLGRMAPENGWRLPEHYTADWQVDRAYSGNPMFRPAGTTPGHSLELGRLALQWWDLAGRPADGTPDRARALILQALADGWAEAGGVVYTLDHDGRVAIPDRYWWPLTEGIGAMASLLKLDPRPGDEAWYRRMWSFADAAFIDHAHGGWFHEIDAGGRPTATQFHGKPDIYHALQAALIPLAPGLSRLQAGLKAAAPGA